MKKTVDDIINEIVNLEQDINTLQLTLHKRKDALIKLANKTTLKDATTEERYNFWLEYANKKDHNFIVDIQPANKEIPNLISVMDDHWMRYETITPKIVASNLKDFLHPVYGSTTYEHTVSPADYSLNNYRPAVVEKRLITQEVVDAWREEIMRMNLGTFIMEW